MLIIKFLNKLYTCMSSLFFLINSNSLLYYELQLLNNLCRIHLMLPLIFQFLTCHVRYITPSYIAYIGSFLNHQCFFWIFYNVFDTFNWPVLSPIHWWTTNHIYLVQLHSINRWQRSSSSSDVQSTQALMSVTNPIFVSNFLSAASHKIKPCFYNITLLQSNLLAVNRIRFPILAR